MNHLAQNHRLLMSLTKKNHLTMNSILGQGYDDNNAIKITNNPRSDADSIVGESITDVYEGKHTVSDKNKTAGEQDVHTSGKAKDTISHPDYNESQKVFSFSLPFGGLTNIRSNLYKQFQAFKQDPLPHVHNHDPIRHEMGLNYNDNNRLAPLTKLIILKTPRVCIMTFISEQ